MTDVEFCDKNFVVFCFPGRALPFRTVMKGTQYEKVYINDDGLGTDIRAGYPRFCGEWVEHILRQWFSEFGLWGRVYF
jgi:hypothetical protein